MSEKVLDQVEVESVWMTESGYPAVIFDVISSEIFGVVISPSGLESCSWNIKGKNLIEKPSFFDLEYSPTRISHKYAVIRDGALIGSAPDLEGAQSISDLNDAELVCKYSELVEHISVIPQ
ncbi:hypothetical protein ACWJJH_18690 [Endozoicomonadaceae bacterium StTr2]